MTIEKSSRERLSSLGCYCCGISMPRIDADIGRQKEKAFERVNQLSHITARKVCTAIPHLKQGVARKEHLLFFPIQAHRTRRMTRSLDDGHIRHAWRILHQAFYRKRLRLSTNTEHIILILHRLCQRNVRRMKENRRVPLFTNPSRTPQMIQMTVRGYY